MVDDMKKQMRRFEHLIGFKGRLDVTSRESMKRLIDALDSRYKSDIRNSIRLHRLEFFHDLVEGRRKRKEKGDKKAEAPVKKRKRKKSDEIEEEDQKEEIPEGPTETDQTDTDDAQSIRATDVDDWKDLMTLSKIYYVLEHPRSEGLKWKRRIVKKKKIEKFTDKDFIEWRVTQNFRLRGLEEWAQSRSDARKLAEQQHFGMDEIESEDDMKELEQLYEMFDPSGRKYKSKERTEKPKKVLSTADRPFKYKDESIEDWTESYSDDSDDMDEDFAEETDDFREDLERKVPESEDEMESAPEEEDDIAEMFSKYPEFTRYREEIFKRMEKAETTEEWFKLYFESCPTLDELEITRKDAPLIAVTEDEEESEPERDDGQKAEKMDKLEETGEDAETESGIKERDLIKEDMKEDETDIEMELKESQLEYDVKNAIQTLVKETIEPHEQFEKEMASPEEEMDTEIKCSIERMIPIIEEETIAQKEPQMATEAEKQPGVSISGEEIHFPEKETIEQRDKLKKEMGIVEEEVDSEIKSVIEEVMPIQKEEITVGEKEQLESPKEIDEDEKKPEKENTARETIETAEEETIELNKLTDEENETVEKNELPLESTDDEMVQIPSEPQKIIDSEIEIIGEKEPKTECSDEDDESETTEDGRMEVHEDIESNDGVAEDRRTENPLKELDETQETENTDNGKEDLLEQDSTSADKEQSEEQGLKKSVNKVNESVDTDENPISEMSNLEVKNSSTKSGKQEKNDYKLDTEKKGGSEEAIKGCSSNQHRRKSKRAVKYSLIPMKDESSTEFSFAVRRSDSQERVLLCDVCSRSITDIPRQDTDDDEATSSETDSKAGEDTEKETESE